MFENFYLVFFAETAWTNMLTLDNSVFWTEKILRPIIVYFVLILLLRIFGKRELGQLNPFDLVVILSLSNTVQNAIIGADNSLVGGVVGAIALLGTNYVVGFLKFKSKRLEEFVEGKPLTLIEKGKLNRRAADRELITAEDLDVVAHHEGFDSADDIEKCILDPNGNFYVEGKDEIKDEKFKREVLRKLEDLNRQLAKLETVKEN